MMKLLLKFKRNSTALYVNMYAYCSPVSREISKGNNFIFNASKNNRFIHVGGTEKRKCRGNGGAFNPDPLVCSI